MRGCRLLQISLLIFAFLILASTPVPAQDGLTPEMVVALKQVTGVALSPSGEKAAFVLRTPRSQDDEPGNAYSEIWMTALKDGTPVRYTAKQASATAVSWSPDGKYITFLEKRDRHDPNTQVYKMRVDGGEAVLMSRHETAIKSYKWAPNGKSIVYIAVDPKSQEEKEAEESGRDWKVPDENFKHRRLWRLDVESGDMHQLYAKDMSAWSFVWTPDSKTIIFQGTDTPRTDDSYMFQKLYKIDAEGGEPQVVCETAGKLGAMSVSPDGKTLAYLGAVSLNDPIAQSLFVVPLAGGTPRNLTEAAEFSGTEVDWLDNETVVLLANRSAATIVSRINIQDGEMTGLISDGPILQQLDLHRKSGRFAAVAHTPEHPREVYAGRLGSTELTRLTNSNPQLNEVKLARQEVIEWKGADDWDIAGVLTYPLDYEQGQRYPLVLQIHGGPEGVSLNGWTTGAGYPVQVLAARGYMVLQPNYRGSGGRGVAFSKADHDDLGGKEFDDVLAGVDALVERGLVDNNRVGTGGWSYGGYFSAWAATKHSERFKASVVAAGLSNWISFTGTTDIPHEMSLVHWNSYWYEKPRLHWERSPVYHINNANTPTLVVHGMKDDRVHPEQGSQLYTHLKLKEVPTKLVLYPREPHGLNERAHQLDFMRRVLAWFDKYVEAQGTF